MPDIFINYRHDDGFAARALKEGLDDSVDVFMDTRLEAGDRPVFAR